MFQNVNNKNKNIRYNKKYNGHKDYMGLLPLLKEGNIVSTRYAYDRVPRLFDVFDNEAFKASGTDFYAVVTNLQTGQPEYMQVKSVFDDMEILRASGSMPFVSKPVELQGRRYLDGGVADSIPFAAMEAMGYEKQLVILTRDMDYRKKPMPAGAIKLWYRHHPQFRDQLLRRHQVYNDSVARLKELEEQGKYFVIRPSRPIEIGRVESDPDKLQAVYELGLQDGEAQLAPLREYLGD